MTIIRALCVILALLSFAAIAEAPKPEGAALTEQQAIALFFQRNLALIAASYNLDTARAEEIIALFGIAVQNGVILISQINQLRREGHPLQDAIVQGSVSRLRPVVMMALMAMLGLIPAAVSTSVG